MSAAATTDRTVTSRDLPGFEGALIADLGTCHRVEFVMTMYEHESAGVFFESWPHAIRERMERDVKAWLDAHKDAKLAAFTCGVVGRACIVVLHYRRAT